MKSKMGRPLRGYEVDQINMTTPLSISKQIEKYGKSRKWSKALAALELVKEGLRANGLEVKE